MCMKSVFNNVYFTMCMKSIFYDVYEKYILQCVWKVYFKMCMKSVFYGSLWETLVPVQWLPQKLLLFVNSLTKNLQKSVVMVCCFSMAGKCFVEEALWSRNRMQVPDSEVSQGWNSCISFTLPHAVQTRNRSSGVINIS